MDNELFDLFQSLEEETPKTRENYIRAPFGYPGGKSSSINKILPHLPESDKYVEPFGGSGAILLARKPSKLEVFNDRYAGVVAFYRCVRDAEKCNQLVERLKLIVHSREEFLWCKQTWEKCEDDVERAARWYYMLQTSFTNQGRAFARVLNGIPSAGMKLVNNLKLFFPLHERIRFVQIENLDWKQCISDFDSDDTVFYMDPPYLDVNSGIYKHEMSKLDHQKLCDRIFELKGFVALSGYDNEIYDKYDWTKKLSWEVSVSLTGKAFTESNYQAGLENNERTSKATEILWIKEFKNG